jgi:hypothetical protein
MALKANPQQEFQKCFQQWQHRWTNFIATEGEYFRGASLSKLKVYGHAYNKTIPGTS